MEQRPNLNKDMDSLTFQNYYYLKEELVHFCRENNLSSSGNKKELLERISLFLDRKEIKEVSIKKRTGIPPEEICESMCIEENFVCTQRHRAFFKKMIGRNFSFNVVFQQWLKENAGKTYKEAILAYHEIQMEKKKGKSKIEPQFEYNAYIRDFFQFNKGRSLQEAIVCWKYKKSLPGHNRYESSDLVALKSSNKK